MPLLVWTTHTNTSGPPPSADPQQQNNNNNSNNNNNNNNNGPPNNQSSEEPVFALFGQSLDIPCRLDGVPSAGLVRWYRENMAISKRHDRYFMLSQAEAGTGDYTLRISKVQHIDDTNFTCGLLAAGKEAPLKVRKVRVTVIRPPANLTVRVLSLVRGPKEADSGAGIQLLESHAKLEEVSGPTSAHFRFDP